MRTKDRFSARFEELRGKRKEDLKRKCFLYSLLFQNDPYAIAYNRSSNRSRLESIENSGFSDKYSIVSIKRLIKGIRQQDLSGIFFPESDRNRSDNSKTNPYSDSLSKGIALVLEIALFPQSQLLLMKENNEWKSLQSIHSIFLLMEDRFSHSNYVSDTKIPHSTHPEVSIRMFRRRIQDASFLHLSRLIFYEYQNLKIPMHSPSREKNSLAILLWNFYAHESESLLIPLWKRFSRLRSDSSVAISDQINLLRKMKLVTESCRTILRNDHNPTKNPCIHYGRYENHFILALRGTHNSARKWIHYLMILRQSHYHCWIQPYRICIKRLSRNCFFFLGYTLGVQSRIKKVRVGTVDESYITASITKESRSTIPTLLLIESLAREGFCDSSGRPVSRSARTALTDDDILNKFLRIWRSISYYYSGSIDRDGLYRLRYILRFSCDKTLACKHKSTTRLIRNRFGSRILPKTLPEESESSHSFPFTDYSNDRRIWCLDIIQLNPLIHMLQDNQY
uniref:maturase K n=1 Tax=Todea barbara TaxID=90702 RepID=UPI0023D7F235|nr:maturase K [Todea barbara]WDE24586.1 maturase K [Todea barbara]